MHKESLIFGDTGIEKRKFFHDKNPVLIEDVDIGEILIPNKVSFGTKGYKYYIGYKHD